MFVSDEYTIKAGQHHSCLKFTPFIKRKKVRITFNFGESCRYYPTSVYQEEMVNKLAGFGCVFHHWRSVRLGWRYDQKTDMIIIYHYEYNRGKLNYFPIHKVKIGQTEQMILESDKPFYFGRMLYPYYGGKIPAPHDVKLKMEFV